MSSSNKSMFLNYDSRLQKTGDDEMVLDTISEFCRNIKSEPSYNRAGEDEEEDEEETAARSSRRKDDMELDEEENDDEDKGRKDKDESMSPDNRY